MRWSTPISTIVLVIVLIGPTMALQGCGWAPNSWEILGLDQERDEDGEATETKALESDVKPTVTSIVSQPTAEGRKETKDPQEPVTVEFAGRTFVVKIADLMGPGPNRFTAQNVYVDGKGHLHIMVTNDAGNWTCGEVYLAEPLGLGEYRWRIRGEFAKDELDRRIVMSAFLYARDDSEAEAIEISAFEDPEADELFQFCLQPAEPDSTHRFAADVDTFTVSLLWESGKIKCRMWDGATGRLISNWTYEGAKVPKVTDKPLVHMNAWIGHRTPGEPAIGTDMIVEDFTFVPLAKEEEVRSDRLAIIAPVDGGRVNHYTTVKGKGKPGTRISLHVRPDADIFYEQDPHPVVDVKGHWSARCIFGNARTPAGYGFSLEARGSNGQRTKLRVTRR